MVGNVEHPRRVNVSGAPESLDAAQGGGTRETGFVRSMDDHVAQWLVVVQRAVAHVDGELAGSLKAAHGRRSLTVFSRYGWLAGSSTVGAKIIPVGSDRYPAASDPVGNLGGLPIDPDIDELAAPPRRRPTSRWPRFAPGVLVAVFVGGVFGGGARYGIGLAAPPAVDGFPWDIFAINLVGAFALAVLLVLVLEVFPPTRYVRPALGTGFIGAFTTFSSLVTATDHLLAHGHPMLAIAYTAGSLFGGLAAASLGLACGRAFSANRHRARTAEGASS